MEKIVNLNTTERTCFFCGNGKGAKKWRFVLSGNRQAYACAVCIFSNGGSRPTLQLLEKKVPYNIPGRLP